MASVQETGDIILVPVFEGLVTPDWYGQAPWTLVGLTSGESSGAQRPSCSWGHCFEDELRLLGHERQQQLGAERTE